MRHGRPALIVFSAWGSQTMRCKSEVLTDTPPLWLWLSTSSLFVLPSESPAREAQLGRKRRSDRTAFRSCPTPTTSESQAWQRAGDPHLNPSAFRRSHTPSPYRPLLGIGDRVLLCPLPLTGLHPAKRSTTSHTRNLEASIFRYRPAARSTPRPLEASSHPASSPLPVSKKKRCMPASLPSCNSFTSSWNRPPEVQHLYRPDRR